MTAYPLDFSYAFGSPVQTATFRHSAEDFVVDELLELSPENQGEHFWLHIEKTGENTDWLAKKLANYFSVRKMDVGYAGKKDRNAVTSQWFSVYLPGKAHEIDWPAFIEMSGLDAKLKRSCSQVKKLKPGQHESNRFKIRLRDVDETSDLLDRLDQVRNVGVPNYFGEQRFGREGGNLDRAQKWAEDPRSIRDRNQRGLIISSARSYLFNLVLSERIKQGNWLAKISGEPQHSEASGPLWGRGLTKASSETEALESICLDDFTVWKSALENVGLKQERRPLCLKPKDFDFEFDSGSLLVSFTLGPGEYATSVLRELVFLNEPART